MHRDDLSCSMCEDKKSEESENHLLKCPILVNHPDMMKEIGQVSYNDVFKDITKQQLAVIVFKQIMKIYEKNKN